ncbi:MAG: hypothetical protein HY812_05155 [Planctomycetes bacterium]|nr:hypothetical protein [Planctomycetota bacterium]
MKGCLAVIGVIALLVVLALVAGVGFFACQGSRAVKEMEAAFARLEETNARFPFSPPADGLLSEERLQRFLTVREQSLPPIQRFIEECERLEDRDARKEGVLAAVRAVFGSLRGALQAFREVPLRLDASLREEGQSLAEYLWITETVHATLIRAYEQGNADAQALVEDIDERLGERKAGFDEDAASYGSLRAALATRESSWNPENLALVLSHAEALVREPYAILLDAVLVRKLGRQEKDDAASPAEEGK